MLKNVRKIRKKIADAGDRTRDHEGTICQFDLGITKISIFSYNFDQVPTNSDT